MFKKLICYSNKIFDLFTIIASVTDERIKAQIPTVKIVTAIIIMYFTNQGSLNSLSQEIAFKKLKACVPSVSTIARTADSMDLEEIRGVGMEIYKKARAKKMLEPYHGMWVGVVDGHEQITSAYCKCKYCKKRTVTKKDGIKDTLYYHEFTAFILAGPKISYTLDIVADSTGRRRDHKCIQAHRESMQKLPQSILCSNRRRAVFKRDSI